ncbi:LAETG motif-containing sortase-dependent surface protein [Streptacidiphilus sp. PAMC 29251]
MSARRRTLAAATVVLAASTAVLTAGTANAAPAGTSSNVTITVGTPTPAGALTLGGSAETFTVTATNHTATAQKFTAQAGGSTAGAIPLEAADVAFQATALGATPATGGSLNAEDGELLGAFYPAGGAFGDSFTIPAHATYSWKLSLAATKAWPRNDGDFTFYVEANAAAVGPVFTTFKVGDGKTGGPVSQIIKGDDIVAPGQPAYETLSLTNNTGATLGKDWRDLLTFAPRDPKGVQTFFNQVTLQANVWNGTTYVPVEAGDSLPALSKDLAPGATAVYRIRVDLVKYTATTAAGQLVLNVDDMSGSTAGAAGKVLTIRRDPQTSASATPSASASAAPSTAPSAAATAPAAATTPATPAAAPAAAATLAETGGGSSTGLLAGIALALLAAGSTVMVALKRRTGRR